MMLLWGIPVYIQQQRQTSTPSSRGRACVGGGASADGHPKRSLGCAAPDTHSDLITRWRMRWLQQHRCILGNAVPAGNAAKGTGTAGPLEPSRPHLSCRPDGRAAPSPWQQGVWWWAGGVFRNVFLSRLGFLQSHTFHLISARSAAHPLTVYVAGTASEV